MERSFSPHPFTVGLCLGTFRPRPSRDGAGAELVGQSVTVQAGKGRSTLSFRRDGRVVARFGGRRTEGRWAVDSRRLCFTW